MVADVGDASIDSTRPTSEGSLLDLAVGATARITNIGGDRAMTRRVLALGLRQGAEVTVTQIRGRGGGLVVACGGTRVALGAEMVRNIRIERVA
jgi:ferrous iron transport protein A